MIYVNNNQQWTWWNSGSWVHYLQNKPDNNNNKSNLTQSCYSDIYFIISSTCFQIISAWGWENFDGTAYYHIIISSWISIIISYLNINFTNDNLVPGVEAIPSHHNMSLWVGCWCNVMLLSSHIYLDKI